MQLRPPREKAACGVIVLAGVRLFQHLYLPRLAQSDRLRRFKLPNRDFSKQKSASTFLT
jgi:hypothetical protein